LVDLNLLEGIGQQGSASQLVIGMDGVGTKIEVATKADKFDQLGWVCSYNFLEVANPLCRIWSGCA